MNMREASSTRHQYIKEAKPTRVHRERRGWPMLVVLILLATSLSWLFLGTSHASSLGSPVKSGWSGYCLDDYRSKAVSGNQVDLWPCNNSSAQDWQLNLTQIIHDKDLCLTANTNSQITVDTCNEDANQVWLRDNTGFLNPDSGKCLTAANGGEDQQLTLSSCNSLTSSTQKWTPNLDYTTYPCSGTQGQLVACNAIKQWVAWTSQPNDHEALLSQYTGGAPFEEWCADFVSYVYKQAGYPFTNGNYFGWNENIASGIVNQGFTIDGGNYTPQPGDVAYFNYPGGHVEIVVSGGKTPTFIYGNSATIDPTTGNGEMAANTVVKDPVLGQLQYYMSPNSST
jgi:hypothetical protein